jgi:short-subunit dehydrogenase
MAQQDLNGRVVVITGASSGFGKGAALKFARAGASVVLSARREQVLEELAGECKAAGGQALPVPADVSQREDVEHLAKTAVSQFGHIDVWVNNAGSGALGRFEEIPLDEHEQVIGTDLFGTLYGSYFAMRQFRQQGSGTLINIASVIGKVPSPYFASYAAAKHGIVGLSAAIRLELKEDKVEDVHVCTVLPTSMDTPFFEHAAQHTGHEATPIPPVYDAEKVVDVIVRLATDPEDEVSVGPAGKFMTFAHQLAPGLVEAMMRRQTQKAEFKDAKPAEDGSGAVKEPMASGTSVGGGWGKTKG